MARTLYGWRPDVPRGGIAQWSDAGDTASYPRTGTAWRDLSGVGKSGTLTNGPTFTGDNGGAIVFDGVSAYAGFSSLFEFLPEFDRTPRTCVMWVNGSGTIISNERTNSSVNLFLVNVNQTSVTMQVGAYTGPPYVENFSITTASTPYAAFTNRWIMVSFTIDRDRNNFSVGVNGYFSESRKAFTIQSFGVFGNVDIARFRNSGFGTQYGACRVGAFALYYRLLDKSEIVAFYEAYRGRYEA